MEKRVFSGVREQWFPLYEKLKAAVTGLTGPFEEQEASRTIRWKHRTSFAEISAKKTALVAAFASDKLRPEWKASKTQQTSRNRIIHYVELTDSSRLPLIAGGIREAYELTMATPPRKREPGKSYSSVDEYIAGFPRNVQDILRAVRKAIRRAAPEAEEKISWQMPTYYFRENLVHFAAAKNHLSLFPTPEAVEAFAPKLKGYTTTKGGIRFPLDKDPPYGLIEEITRWRLDQVKKKDTQPKSKRF
ncbi:DUF5655 domain-containing protein [Breznakiella homolactica]|uniref:DUF1801 domain-containing protein n=1 Tax=Breznakiella homolactica TaxID=2798577 RepID=A0A7T7XLV2_9SPIR|nr:DUF5655 domain-containing protein [Breznakiella homolactica]QQO08775.1 DUF5655 domain-containing protein [Breznakiella homolactica]